MLVSLFLIAIVTLGGFAITYIIDDDGPIMWRLAAGNIIGAAILGTAGFLLSLAFGLNPGVAIAGLGLTAAPLLLFADAHRRRNLDHEWSRAKGKLQGFSGRKFLRFTYYASFFVLFFFFFDRAMLESSAGIFTGGSQNLGDLPFHLGAILGFTEGNNFPPQNPSFAGARFSYPFIADLLTAIFVKFGASVRDAMFVQNVSWAFSLTVILERFVLSLTRDHLAARLAPWLLFLSGGLGFIWFFGDYAAQAKSFLDFLNHLPKDYTIGENFRWGNSMVVLFITQRSLLLGMPLTLIVLGYLWRIFSLLDDKTDEIQNPKSKIQNIAPLVVGILAGLLPLIHLHSFAVLFIVGVFLFILRPEQWRTWMLFAAGVAVIALPELLWSVSGSATEAKNFFGWHFGWDKGDKNFLWFWLINTGIFIPALLIAIYLFGFHQNSTEQTDGLTQSRKAAKKQDQKRAANDEHHQPAGSHFTPHTSHLLFFFVPFAFLFVVSNAAKLAPWEWDNIKVLIYWFVGSIPFVALLISWLWRKQVVAWRALAVLCFVVLIASGALDVWRTTSAQINYKVFDKDAVEIASQIRLRTAPNALFLNAPTYNTAIVLGGRQSLMRYPGHLSSHGINYAERTLDVKQIYQGDASALRSMEKYGIDYVLISPEERTNAQVNDQFFARYPVIAEAGQYKVYKIR